MVHENRWMIKMMYEAMEGLERKGGSKDLFWFFLVHQAWRVWVSATRICIYNVHECRHHVYAHVDEVMISPNIRQRDKEQRKQAKMRRTHSRKTKFRPEIVVAAFVILWITREAKWFTPHRLRLTRIVYDEVTLYDNTNKKIIHLYGKVY